MTKISAYPTISTLASGDLFDTSQDTGGGTYATKSIDYADLLAQLQSDIVFPPAITYYKHTVLINSIPSALLESASDQKVINLEYTILTDGDYVFYATCNMDVSNDDLKPISLVLYHEPLSTGVNAVEEDSRTQEYAKKNIFQTCQTTFKMNGLLTGDIISVYVNNNDEGDIDAISVGRLMVQSWG